jgi:hypothetical protein
MISGSSMNSGGAKLRLPVLYEAGLPNPKSTRQGDVMKLNRVRIVAMLTLAVCAMTAKAQTVKLTSFGYQWNTTSGAQITAHGGQILKEGSTYYWIGEVDSSGGGFQGINCYSSTNLTSWTLVGDILPPQSSGDLATSDLVERPKVLYNSSTGKYVMWLHIWNGDAVGYATSSSVCGSYAYLGSSQPLGNESFDIGSFQDTNGNAYLLSANYDNGIIVYMMNSAYTAPVSIVDGVSTWGDYEAPAMFRANGYYFMIMSHQTGWSSNDDVYSYATSISGPWSTPVDFANAGTHTYNSQSTYVVPVTGSSGTVYMYMGDRWNSSDITDSTYVWLPLSISGSSLSMNFYASWNLNITAGTWAVNHVAPTTGSDLPLISQNSGMCLSGVNSTEGTQLEQATCNSTTLQQWDVSSEGSGYYLTNVDNGMVADDSGNSKTAGGAVIDWDKNADTNQEWTFVPNGEGYYNIINVSSGLCLDVISASKSSGALIDQYTCNDGTNQNWKQ